MSRCFVLRRAVLLRPLLLLAGLARDSNSYAAIEGEELRARFGWFFNHVFPIADIESGSRLRWPWYYGLGWRANLAGLVGLVASFDGVVEVRFKRRQKVGGIIPSLGVPCDRLALSLEQPDEFIATLRQSVE